MSLSGLARGIGRVAGAPSRPDAEPHAAAVATAMLEHPWAVHGETSSNTVVMRELGLLAKAGADGVLVMAAPDGTAVAVKALDGGTRAGDLVALALLARFAPDHVDRATLPGVLAAVVPPVLGRASRWARSAWPPPVWTIRTTTWMIIPKSPARPTRMPIYRSPCSTPPSRECSKNSPPMGISFPSPAIPTVGRCACLGRAPS